MAVLLASGAWAGRFRQPSFCDVARHPERFSGRTLKLIADLSPPDVHGMSFSDAACPKELLMASVPDTPFDKMLHSGWGPEKLNMRVTVTGRLFRSEGPFPGSSKLWAFHVETVLAASVG